MRFWSSVTTSKLVCCFKIWISLLQMLFGCWLKKITWKFVNIFNIGREQKRSQKVFYIPSKKSKAGKHICLKSFASLDAVIIVTQLHNICLFFYTYVLLHCLTPELTTHCMPLCLDFLILQLRRKLLDTQKLLEREQLSNKQLMQRLVRNIVYKVNTDTLNRSLSEIYKGSYWQKNCLPISLVFSAFGYYPHISYTYDTSRPN